LKIRIWLTKHQTRELEKLYGILLHQNSLWEQPNMTASSTAELVLTINQSVFLFKGQVVE